MDQYGSGNPEEVYNDEMLFIYTEGNFIKRFTNEVTRFIKKK
jgi:hypothetical protein